jgi:hypothetical protein
LKQPAHCKYTPLEAWFRQMPAAQRELNLAFSQIEQVMDKPLPKSAYQRQTWWDNEVHATLSHKNAWLHAGWKVAAVELAEQKVRFRRG